MRNLVLRFSVLAILLFSSSPVLSTILPIEPVNKGRSAVHKKMLSLKVRDIQRLTGKKMSLKEKIAFGILKRKLKRQEDPSSSNGQLSLIFGITGVAFFIAGFFLPAFFLASIVAAIIAIVVGSVAKKKNHEDRKAFAGELLGWITLGLILATALLAILLISALI